MPSENMPSENMLSKNKSIAINYSNVEKRYSKQIVLNGIDLKVEVGTFFGLVGANGAGKTTMIKSLLDFVDINSGSIEIFGQKNRSPQSRDNLAFLPERFVPPYFFKGIDFLKYVSKLHNVDFNEDKAKELCASLDFDPKALKKSVRTYSKGMAQKLGLIGCLFSNKKLLILDEPMSGLDPRARVFFKRCLNEFKKRNITLFFSTHMLADVDAICDKMAILDKGKICFTGTTDECRQKYGAEDLEEAYLNCVYKD